MAFKEQMYAGVSAAALAVVTYMGAHAVAEHRPGDTHLAQVCQDIETKTPFDAAAFDKQCAIYEGKQIGVSSKGSSSVGPVYAVPTVEQFIKDKIPQAENWDNRRREAAGGIAGLLAGTGWYLLGRNMSGLGFRRRRN